MSAPYILYEHQHDLLNNFLENKGIVILSEQRTNGFCVPVAKQILPQLHQAQSIVIPSGEAYKSLEIYQYIIQCLVNLGAQRNTVLVCIGGGMLLDIGGFVAATYMRGITVVHIPTTVLAQVDAAIGEKVAVNYIDGLHVIKNLVGTFKQPQYVYCDSRFFDTLPEREIVSGIVEQLKHAILDGSEHFQQLISCTQIQHYYNYISTSHRIKHQIVEQDKFDNNKRQQLNFGHTIGHALEATHAHNSQPLLHGEAVLLGMLAELHISETKLACSKELRTSLEQWQQKFMQSLPKLLQIDIDACLNAMMYDKKADVCINMSLLRQAGDCVVQVPVIRTEIINALNYLSAYASGA